MSVHKIEVQQGERFEFGANWTRFLASLNEERIEEAKMSLRIKLGVETLEGKSFLDIGSGSGLFSLAARMLGAYVYSFDYDPYSVACTNELKRRYFAEDKHWLIKEGSVLDKNYLSNLGRFDVVYSWGVLHHTGNMWEAFSNIIPLVTDGGLLFLAIYNDAGRSSVIYRKIKKLYCTAPEPFRTILLFAVLVRLWGLTTIRDLAFGRPGSTWNSYSKNRGMSAWHDVVDWVGGYPYEVAKPEEIFDFFITHDFVLQKLKTCAGGHGCNEFVLKKLSKRT